MESHLSSAASMTLQALPSCDPRATSSSYRRSRTGHHGQPQDRTPRVSGYIPAAQAHIGLVVRDRIELSTFRFSGGRSYRLSYLTWLDTQ